ncbi:MAG: hypothetical protein NC110_05275 [Ruminococcus sp.]|nr:hypothetical protein [Ruminococcus sp.]
MRNRIPINKEIIPYNFEIVLGNENFVFEINHGVTNDIFTVTLYKNNELLCTEPIIYGVPLFSDIYKPEKFPSIEIVPLDESNTETEVNCSNFGDTVFLTIDDEGEE